jgi:predicted PurR-regulated permease PerM
MNQTSEGQRVTSLLFYGAVVLIAVLAYRIVLPFLAEIGWAVVLAICVAPVQVRLARRLGPTRSAVVLTLGVLLLLVLPLLFVAQMLVREGAQAVDYVKSNVADRGGPMGLFHLAWQWLRQHFPFLPDEQELVQQLSERLGALASQAAGHAGRIVKEAVAFLFSLTITLCILFFMLKDAPDMERAVRRMLPFGRERNADLLAIIRDIVSTSVTSTLVIAVIQGFVGGTAFLLLGVPGALLWGCLMAVLAILPAVGAALVWAPAAIWLALSGSLFKGVVLALVGVLVMGNGDNVVRPLMLSGRSRMSTLVLIISLLGGVSAFGFIGVVLGPVVAAVLTGLVEAYALMDEEGTEAAPRASVAPPVEGSPSTDPAPTPPPAAPPA